MSDTLSFVHDCPDLRHAPEGFSGWSYPYMVWSDFTDEVPPLSKKRNFFDSEEWHSDVIPQSGQTRTVKVCFPFEEKIGNEFYMDYTPKPDDLDDSKSADDFERSAVVRCRFTELLVANDYEAWIKVLVLEVIMFRQLVTVCDAYETDKPLTDFGGCLGVGSGIDCREDCSEGPWKAITLDAQSDVTEEKVFFTDENGVCHLVWMNENPYNELISYFGNVIQKKTK